MRNCAGDTLTIEQMLTALRARMPSDAIVVEEAPSTHTTLHDVLPMRPGRYLSAASGSLGYGLPAAVGAALARPGRRVVGLIGDGSSHYGTVGLWTAAHHRLPITFVIVNNEGYGAMRSFVELLGHDRSLDYSITGIDFVALGNAFGLRSSRVSTVAELEAALDASFAEPMPSLIDVMVDARAGTLF